MIESDLGAENQLLWRGAPYGKLPVMPDPPNAISVFLNKHQHPRKWVLPGDSGTLPLQAAAQLDSQAMTVEDLRKDFNQLLAHLRTTGVIEP